MITTKTTVKYIVLDENGVKRETTSYNEASLWYYDASRVVDDQSKIALWHVTTVEITEKLLPLGK